MYSKEFRLVLAKDFEETIKRGKVFKTPFFKVYCWKNTSAKKIGFIVSNKTGNAVRRNCIKRRLRELFKEILVKQNNFYIVVIGFRSAEKAAHKDLVFWKNKTEEKIFQGTQHENNCT